MGMCLRGESSASLRKPVTLAVLYDKFPCLQGVWVYDIYVIQKIEPPDKQSFFWELLYNLYNHKSNRYPRHFNIFLTYTHHDQYVSLLSFLDYPVGDTLPQRVSCPFGCVAVGSALQ